MANIELLSTPQTVRELLARIEATPEAVKAIPKHVDRDRLLSAAFMAVQRNPRLLECTRKSFGGAIARCAQFGLYPDIRGHCFLIPRRTGPKVAGGRLMEVNFQLGYQGLLELARRSGQIAKFEARVVREADTFAYQYGTTPMIEHTPARHDAGELVACYAVAWLATSREPQFEVMEKDDVMLVRDRAMNTDRDDSPWRLYESEMWRKTVAIRLCKYLPASTDLADATALDDLSAADKPQHLAIPGTESAEDAPDAIDDLGADGISAAELMATAGDTGEAT